MKSRLAGVAVPGPDRALDGHPAAGPSRGVPAPGEERPDRRAERQEVVAERVASDPADQAARRRIGEGDPFAASPGQPPTVRRAGHDLGRDAMIRGATDLTARRDIPGPDQAIVAARRDQRAAARDEGESRGACRRLPDVADLHAGGRIPEPDHPVITQGREDLAVGGVGHLADRAAVAESRRPQAGHGPGGERIAGAIDRPRRARDHRLHHPRDEDEAPKAPRTVRAMPSPTDSRPLTPSRTSAFID